MKVFFSNVFVFIFFSLSVYRLFKGWEINDLCNLLKKLFVESFIMILKL